MRYRITWRDVNRSVSYLIQIITASITQLGDKMIRDACITILELIPRDEKQNTRKRIGEISPALRQCLHEFGFRFNLEWIVFQFVFTCEIQLEYWNHVRKGEHASAFGRSCRTFDSRMKLYPGLHESEATIHSGSTVGSWMKNGMNSFRNESCGMSCSD